MKMVALLKQPDREHLQVIVDLHCAAFPGFFLTSLGQRMMNRWVWGIAGL
jgi:hypothetical protein